MGHDSAHSRAGLNLEVWEQPKGLHMFRLTDDTGQVVKEGSGYSSRNSAQATVRSWISRNYQGAETVSVADPLPPGPRSGRKPQTEVERLAADLRRKAQAGLEQALRLRQTADQLEAEAKRLEAAADVLGGPEDA